MDERHPDARWAAPLSDKEDGNLYMNGDWLSALLSWWPFVVLIGAWIVVSRFTNRTKSGVSVIQPCEQQLTETQRIDANLERIVAALDKRPQC
ncbi:hypothetical protein AAFX91_30545 [Bradyrhizobium sp. 31Argb]|uniref:hypothetical protein n=1 Tax=Bradyrhizobium sp. 31Argb TaxID=3141247 RepID=UPI0037487E7A